MTNMDPEVKSLLSATAACKLCPTVLGQAAVDCAVNPPQPGDESYQLYIQEKDNILNSLADKAIRVTNEFNSIPSISCSLIQGAMYAYPTVFILFLAYLQYILICIFYRLKFHPKLFQLPSYWVKSQMYFTH
jgi:alanine transaminase